MNFITCHVSRLRAWPLPSESHLLYPEPDDRPRHDMIKERVEAIPVRREVPPGVPGWPNDPARHARTHSTPIAIVVDAIFSVLFAGEQKRRECSILESVVHAIHPSFDARCNLVLAKEPVLGSSAAGCGGGGVM